MHSFTFVILWILIFYRSATRILSFSYPLCSSVSVLTTRHHILTSPACVTKQLTQLTRGLAANSERNFLDLGHRCHQLRKAGFHARSLHDGLRPQGFTPAEFVLVKGSVSYCLFEEIDKASYKAKSLVDGSNIRKTVSNR